MLYKYIVLVEAPYSVLATGYSYSTVTGWVRIPFTDVIRTSIISILNPAKMHSLSEVVRGLDGFLSEFSIPQGNPTQPATMRSDYEMIYFSAQN